MERAQQPLVDRRAVEHERIEVLHRRQLGGDRMCATFTRIGLPAISTSSWLQSNWSASSA